MEIRKPDADDAERMGEVARSALTASYRLSPGQIDAVLADQFGDERLDGIVGGSDAVAFVAENGEETDAVVGVAIAAIEGDVGDVRWLFVDPEHRGEGIGTELFETTVEAVRDRGVERVQASTLEANTEGAQFFERFEFVRTDDRRVEIGDESLVEFVYTEPSVADEEDETDSARTDDDEVEFPDAEVRDGVVVATTDDGREVFVDRDDEESGTEASFYPAYVDEEFGEQFGFYCSNCGSLDVQADSMDRLECGECGNSHASRSSESYDESYL